MTADELLGSWTRDAGEPCVARYPPGLELRPDDVYLAPEGPRLGSLWHGGTWLVEDGGTLVVEAANDALLRYRIVEATQDRLTLEAADGCRVTYRRR